MKPKMYLLLPLLLTGALFITSSAWAKGGEAIRVGRTATITFDHETLVGNVMFQPGDYAVRHRAVGANQFMVFQRTETNYVTSDTEDVGKPQRVECRMEPLSAKVSDSTFSIVPDGKLEKLTKIEIAGENVEHLF